MTEQKLWVCECGCGWAGEQTTCWYCGTEGDRTWRLSPDAGAQFYRADDPLAGDQTVPPSQLHVVHDDGSEEVVAIP